jgi:hypothetical protein
MLQKLLYGWVHALYHVDMIMIPCMGRARAADCPQLKPMGWKRGHPVVYIVGPITEVPIMLL